MRGKSDILRDFKVSRVDSPVAGTLALRLDPRKQDPDYEFLVVAFHPTSYQIRGLTTHDRQGGESTIVFSDIKENTSIRRQDVLVHATARSDRLEHRRTLTAS